MWLNILRDSRGWNRINWGGITRGGFIGEDYIPAKECSSAKIRWKTSHLYRFIKEAKRHKRVGIWESERGPQGSSEYGNSGRNEDRRVSRGQVTGHSKEFIKTIRAVTCLHLLSRETTLNAMWLLSQMIKFKLLSVLLRTIHYSFTPKEITTLSMAMNLARCSDESTVLALV